MPDEQAQHQLLHPAGHFRQAPYAPEGTEVSLAEDGQNRSASLWLHGSPSQRCGKSPPNSTAPRMVFPPARMSNIFSLVPSGRGRGGEGATRRGGEGHHYDMVFSLSHSPPLARLRRRRA